MGSDGKKISMAVVKRLPKYLRYLGELMEKGEERTSSHELSKLTGFTASQIRQDLNNFGGFGQQGYGYHVSQLQSEIKRILGLNNKYNMIIIGAGNMGQALTNYVGFEKMGFNITALFDINPRLIGLSIRGIEVCDIDELSNYLLENKTDIAIMTVPKSAAQDITNILVQNGVRGIWNFSPIDLKAPDEITVENVHLSESLMTLVYRLNK